MQFSGHFDDASTLSEGTAANGQQILPHLPGYRSNRPQYQRHRHALKVHSGMRFLEEDDATFASTRRLAQTSSATSLAIGQAGSRPATSGGVRTRSEEEGTGVLCFHAYFKESVHESQLETYRIRKCDLLFYLEDETLQINERKMENSGVPQGNFMKRHKVPKDDYEHITLQDLEIGGMLTVYGRTFHIIDALPATKEYMQSLGFDVSNVTAFPTDRYETVRADIVSRETGKHPGPHHNIKKNPMKDFAEAMLGKTVNNSGREGFLKFDRKVLRFHCVWDDRKSLYGDVQRFKLHYFLTDDTVEVLCVYEANSGRDPYPLLLRRSKLPRNLRDEKQGFYHWRELAIGRTVDVYARELLIVDADKSTRQFYEEQGIVLGEPQYPEEREPEPIINQIPPATGFGSEEDSLTSCVGSLVQTAPKKQLGENKVLRFLSEFVTDKPEDVGREFVVSYFLMDNSVSIHEPPKRNSGIVGGSFLTRTAGKTRDDEGNILEQRHFFVGATIRLVGHTFLLKDSDDSTLRHMEQNLNIFPHSDPQGVLHRWVKKGDYFFTDAETGALQKACVEASKNGESLTVAEMQSTLKVYGLDKPEQAIITVIRAFGDKGTIPIDTFVDEIRACC